MTLFEHAPDCVPLMPCPACEIVVWLRGKLSADDFAELVKRANGLAPPPKKRAYRSRLHRLPHHPAATATSAE